MIRGLSSGGSILGT